MAAAAKVKQNCSTGDAQLPVKTQKILEEKNELILKMREEIQAKIFLPSSIIFSFLFFAGDEDDDERPYRRRVLVTVGSCSQEKHLDGGSGDPI